MNERIQILAKQCWDERLEGQLHFDNEKFALLIVRECAEFQTNRSTERHGYDKHEDGVAIKQHFGVAE